MLSFKELESQCDTCFLEHKEWWHLFTPGMDTSVIWRTTDEYKYAMNLMARCCTDIPELKIVSFAIMSNHIHIIATSEIKYLILFFNTFKNRLKRYLRTRGDSFILKPFTMQYKSIDSIFSLRNAIIYVNRNGYNTSPQYTPFTYPWSTGPYYFVVRTNQHSFSKLTKNQKRKMFKSRTPNIPKTYNVFDGYVTPDSFCDIALGMSIFRNANHYFTSLFKPYETSSIPIWTNEREIYTDEELFQVVYRIIKDYYHTDSLKLLSKNQKIDLAKRLYSDFRSSKNQIRRMLYLSAEDVETIFKEY